MEVACSLDLGKNLLKSVLNVSNLILHIEGCNGIGHNFH